MVMVVVKCSVIMIYFQIKKEWHVVSFHGEWLPGFSAGGCGNEPHKGM